MPNFDPDIENRQKKNEPKTFYYYFSQNIDNFNKSN